MSSVFDLDQQFMGRAIRLAMNGRGRVEPNPMVGCVIVKDGRAIGEGYHQQYGGPHAEPNALASCNESPQGATAYVTLEPCCHTNKKTPPCVPKLIEAKLARVVVGCLDPNPEVDGKGVAMLREAGIVVDAPVLEAEAKQLIAAYIARTCHRRPYVTLKWAETADGKVAGAGGRPMRISNARSRQIVHELRSRCDAIAVGMGTLRKDDPLLTPRGVTPLRTPIRAVLGGSGLQVSGNLIKTVAQGSVLRYFPMQATQTQYTADALAKLDHMGINAVALPSDGPNNLSLPAFLKDMYERGVTHLLVEPGPTLAASFFRDELVDRLWLFRSPNFIGDDSAPSAAAIPGNFVKTGQAELEGDVLHEYLNPRSPVFFAAEASADFVLR
jgi:diaminohydroxyphosphoribosylaminopyrimidine deaminase/5-amino-6-(5-phosphoribosylamino)uracil reductase